MSRGKWAVATILLFAIIFSSPAIGKKTTFSCVEDPLFSTCLSQQPVGCSQIYQNGGGADSDFCNDAGGAGQNLMSWLYNGTWLFPNTTTNVLANVNFSVYGHSEMSTASVMSPSADNLGVLRVNNTLGGNNVVATFGIAGKRIQVARTAGVFGLFADKSMFFTTDSLDSYVFIRDSGTTQYAAATGSYHEFLDTATIAGDLNVSENTKLDSNLTVRDTANITQYITPSGEHYYSIYSMNDDMVLDVSEIGGSNFFEIATAGAFYQLYANPGPSNGYLLASWAETQGADTFINLYEGGTTHNRLWDSGSMRLGGLESYLCSAQVPLFVDCNTATTGADLVIQDAIQTGGDGFFVNGSSNITDEGFVTSGNVTGDWFCMNAACTSYIYNNGTDSLWV